MTKPKPASDDPAQGDLLSGMPIKRKLSLKEKFYAYHAQNPKVYLALEARAMSYAQRGVRTGIGRITEELRWDPALRAEDDNSGFKINNSYRAFYARLLIREHPALEEILETRKQHNGAKP